MAGWRGNYNYSKIGKEAGLSIFLVSGEGVFDDGLGSAGQIGYNLGKSVIGFNKSLDPDAIGGRHDFKTVADSATSLR